MTHEWYYEQFENHTRFGMQVKRHLVSEQSEFQKIELFEAERYGRVLALDGVYQTSELEEYFYHEMLVHPAMTSAPNIRRALVIGGGDGGTAREILKHPEVEQCVMVEIDARVVEACKAHLPTIGTAWDDPRLSLRIGDGIAFCLKFSFVSRQGGHGFSGTLMTSAKPASIPSGRRMDWHRASCMAGASRGKTGRRMPARSVEPRSSAGRHYCAW